MGDRFGTVAGPIPGPWARLAGLALLGLFGCTRAHYREKADRDVYTLQEERLIDPRWQIPLRPVEADPRSRMRDPHDPDREPFPPDDPAALEFQISERLHPWRGFRGRIERRGVRPIEDDGWLALLPKGPDGTVLLTRGSAMQLAVVNSRDYQFQVEELYLSALSVSLARFGFQVQPFFNESLAFRHAGSSSNESNQFLPVGQLGFAKQFYSGAQLLVDFANNLVFEFSGDGFTTALSSLTISLTQPLLRGAFARNVTQPLSLQERGLLYTIRDFARFRRGLYVDVVAGSGYLGLLQQLQAIRNAEENLRSLERNLEETEALFTAGIKTVSERDQVALQYQQQQVALLSLEANLQTSLDLYRVRQLALPPDLPMTIDDAPLQIFELNDPRITDLRAANDRLHLALLKEDQAPPRAEMVETTRSLLANLDLVAELLAATRDELAIWQERLERTRVLDEVPLPDARPRERRSFEANLAQILDDTLRGTTDRLIDNQESARTLAGGLEGGDPLDLEAAWLTLRRLVNDDFRGRLADVFAAQTQVRVFLIELPEIDLEVEPAVALALANRQDLMNSRAQVADAWRNVEVAANALQAGLSVNYLGNLATDPNRDDIFRFDASASAHRFGLRYDAPLVRRAERNAYRAAWIAYQRARRAYMLNHDEVVRQIRLDIRNLELSRRQFEIGREQLVTAVRQVEENESTYRFNTEPNASLTLLLLSSLNSLLSAKNTLIGTWVDYETARMGLYRDLDILDIDARGVWTNEHIDPSLFTLPIPDAGPLPGPGLFTESGPSAPPELGIPSIP